MDMNSHTLSLNYLGELHLDCPFIEGTHEELDGLTLRFLLQQQQKHSFWPRRDLFLKIDTVSPPLTHAHKT